MAEQSTPEMSDMSPSIARGHDCHGRCICQDPTKSSDECEVVWMMISRKLRAGLIQAKQLGLTKRQVNNH